MGERPSRSRYTHVRIRIRKGTRVRESRNGGVSRGGRTRLFATTKKKARRPDSLLL